MNVNWPAVQAAAFTAIRLEWPLWKLIWMAAGGNSTPVSGDALAQARKDLRTTSTSGKINS